MPNRQRRERLYTNPIIKYNETHRNPRWWDSLAYGNDHSSSILPIPHDFGVVKTILGILAVIALLEFL